MASDATGQSRHSRPAADIEGIVAGAAGKHDILNVDELERTAVRYGQKAITEGEVDQGE